MKEAIFCTLMPFFLVLIVKLFVSSSDWEQLGIELFTFLEPTNQYLYIHTGVQKHSDNPILMVLSLLLLICFSPLYCCYWIFFGEHQNKLPSSQKPLIKYIQTCLSMLGAIMLYVGMLSFGGENFYYKRNQEFWINLTHSNEVIFICCYFIPVVFLTYTSAIIIKR